MAPLRLTQQTLDELNLYSMETLANRVAEQVLEFEDAWDELQEDVPLADDRVESWDSTKEDRRSSDLAHLMAPSPLPLEDCWFDDQVDEFELFTACLLVSYSYWWGSTCSSSNQSQTTTPSEEKVPTPERLIQAFIDDVWLTV